MNASSRQRPDWKFYIVGTIVAVIVAMPGLIFLAVWIVFSGGMLGK